MPESLCHLSSLGSRPSPFRARFNYAHAANIRSKLGLGSNVYRMRIIKAHTERGRPGSEATIYHHYALLWRQQ